MWIRPVSDCEARDRRNWRSAIDLAHERPAPAMAAGVADTPWMMENLYDAVLERDNEAQQRERYDRLITKLTGVK